MTSSNCSRIDRCSEYVYISTHFSKYVCISASYMADILWGMYDRCCRLHVFLVGLYISMEYIYKILYYICARAHQSKCKSDVPISATPGGIIRAVQQCAVGVCHESHSWFRAPSGPMTTFLFVPRPLMCFETGRRGLCSAVDWNSEDAACMLIRAYFMIGVNYPVVMNNCQRLYKIMFGNFTYEYLAVIIHNCNLITVIIIYMCMKYIIRFIATVWLYVSSFLHAAHI
jgi:hypothetical protein